MVSRDGAQPQTPLGCVLLFFSQPHATPPNPTQPQVATRNPKKQHATPKSNTQPRKATRNPKKPPKKGFSPPNDAMRVWKQIYDTCNAS